MTKESAPKRVIFYTPDRKKVLISSPTASVLVKIFLAVIVINLAILNFFFLREAVSFKKIRDVTTESAEIMVLESENLLNKVDFEKLKSEFKDRVVIVEGQPEYFSPVQTDYTPAIPASGDFKHKMEYFKFSGTNETSSIVWWNIPGAEVSFNIANFPNASNWWEASLRIKNDTGKALARIFDATANIPVEGSEIEVSSADLVKVSSGLLKFSPGDRTYKIQIKSLFGEEVVIEDARIKISWIEE